jgi:antagonist of KipI
MANGLVGNSPDEAVLEMHFPGPQLLFHSSAMVSIAGADFCPTVNGKTTPVGHPLLIHKNAVLKFKERTSGSRSYMAVGGGFALRPWLKSFSTNLQAGYGGFSGRSLQKGDELKFADQSIKTVGANEGGVEVLPWRTRALEAISNLFVLPGKQWGKLKPGEQEKFLKQPFTITSKANRMGYYLHGQPLDIEDAGELISSAVSFGSVQLLPNGQLIVLGADHQATGGYPVIAHVVSAHHSIFSQLKPGDSITFEITTQVTAESLFAEQQKDLLLLQHACKLKLSEWYK